MSCLAICLIVVVEMWKAVCVRCVRFESGCASLDVFNYN